MHVTYRNVNESFRSLVSHFHHPGLGADGMKAFRNVVRRPFKNPNGEGYTLAIEEPVTITLEKPLERVLFNAARDANPFLHLYESLWMLAGRNDVAPLAYYSKGITQFSDDGKTFNGAYGERWRHAMVSDPSHGMYDTGSSLMDVDQLDLLVAHLQAQPNSRRAVLQMWNVEDDLLKIGGTGDRTRCKTCSGTGAVGKPGDDEGDPMTKCPTCGGTAFMDEPGSKDVCCNTEVMFSLRDEEWSKAYPPMGITASVRKVLDMTVINRSNDLVWGLCGANAVHFSFLQEYMAARIGVAVGRFHTMTNNLHVYNENAYYKWEPEKWLTGPELGQYHHFLAGPQMLTVPLVSDPAVFDLQVADFVTHFSGIARPEDLAEEWDEPFLQNVAQPMLLAFACYKEGAMHDAFTCMDEVAADDWRIAGRNWLERRNKG